MSLFAHVPASALGTTNSMLRYGTLPEWKTAARKRKRKKTGGSRRGQGRDTLEVLEAPLAAIFAGPACCAQRWLVPRLPAGCRHCSSVLLFSLKTLELTRATWVCGAHSPSRHFRTLTLGVSGCSDAPDPRHPYEGLSRRAGVSTGHVGGAGVRAGSR